MKNPVRWIAPLLLAANTLDALNASGDKVVLLACAGQDLSKYGVRYSHLGLAWQQFKGYQPTVLKLGPVTRLGGRMTAANVAFDDHPNAKRFSDRIETVTVDSVFAWLQRAQLVPAGKSPVTLKL